MLFCLLFFIYITWLSEGWGRIACKLLYKAPLAAGGPVYSLWLNALTGLCAICFVATALSLFIPLGGWLVHAAFAAPVLVLSCKEGFFLNRIKDAFPSNWYFVLLMVASVMLILVMHAWVINHPDTLGYHAEAVAWINRYKAIPGLVHTNDRLGLGSSWFVLCSLFSFSFLHLQALTFINAVILIWATAFVIQKAGCFLGQQSWLALPCLVLFAFAFCCYTQARLTVTSASPDYIASLLIMAVVYTTLTGRYSSLHILLLSITAVCIKLSAVPVLLIPAGLFWVKNRSAFRIKRLVLFLLTGCLLLLPLLLRNIITSGYIVYPQPGLQAGPVQNALPPGFVQLQRDYIKAYARIPVDADPRKVAAVLKMPARQWVPVWWHNRSRADQLLLIIAATACILLCLYPVRLLRNTAFRTGICLMAMAAGCLFWAVTAPDPRFGNGFLLGFSGLTALCLIKDRPLNDRWRDAIAGILVTCLLAGILFYTAYRVINFSSIHSLLAPLGTGSPVSLKLPPEQ